MHPFRSLLARFFCARDGIAAVEFAYLAPILLMLLMGAIETSNYIMVSSKTEKLASTVADLVSQASSVTTKDLDTILAASESMFEPFDFQSTGHIIITAVKRDPASSPKVAWQYEGGGKLTGNTSNYGSTGFSSPLPTGFILNEREMVIIAEVYYNYTPFITQMFGGVSQLYKSAFYKPRLGSLDTIQSN